MIQEPDERREQKRSALTTLSVVGATVAGGGIEVLLAPALRPAAWLIIAVGLASHLVGMVSIRRLLSEQGYRSPGWQGAAFWLCWAAIATLVVYAVWELAR